MKFYMIMPWQELCTLCTQEEARTELISMIKQNYSLFVNLPNQALYSLSFNQ